MMRSLPSRAASAYTLLEVLAVVLLMGLIAAVMVPRLAGTSDRTEQSLLISQLVQLDAQARLLAREGQWCMLRWDEEQRSLELVRGGSEPQAIRKVKLDQRQELKDRFETVVFDSFGRSPDYTLRLSDAGAATELRFNGVSGWHEIDTHED